MDNVYVVVMFAPGEMRIKAVFATAFAALQYVNKWGREVTGFVALSSKIWTNSVCHFTIQTFPLKLE